KVIRSQDRAAVMVFDDTMQLRVPLTNDTRILTDALEGLESSGDTTLYDSLIEALFYFAGLDGKRALILISDGSDSASRYTFMEALEYAQRSGAAIYPITLGMSPRDRMVRGRMLRLAGETGGRAYFVSGVGEIDRVYAEIETDLRSQYLVAYQSSSTSSQSGLKATTVPGYYP
ncbi:MAG: VWA domain-containing protein, partial [Acidobacteriota bacterium]